MMAERRRQHRPKREVVVDDYDEEYLSSDDEILKKTGRWTAEEDDALRAGVEALGAEKAWRRIADDFVLTKKTDAQCMHRWNKVRPASTI